MFIQSPGIFVVPISTLFFLYPVYPYLKKDKSTEYIKWGNRNHENEKNPKKQIKFP